MFLGLMGGWPGPSVLFILSSFETVDAPLLRFLQGRVRCYGLRLSHASMVPDVNYLL